MRMPIILSLLTCALLLSACGKKGPVYLPDDKAEKPLASNHSNALRLQPHQEKS